jgi:hypothetical protein
MHAGVAPTRSAQLHAKVQQLNAELEEWTDEVEPFLDDPAGEARTLREFIEDVRLGIRDLSEYEDICGRRLSH